LSAYEEGVESLLRLILLPRRQDFVRFKEKFKYVPSYFVIMGGVYSAFVRAEFDREFPKKKK